MASGLTPADAAWHATAALIATRWGSARQVLS
jgi:hypothetical protein